MQAKNLPDAIVLGIDSPIGLTVVRELGEGGVRVFGMGRTRNCLGAKSRFIHRSLVREKSETELVAQLIELAKTLYDPCLLVVGESDILLLNRNRNALEKHMLLIVPSDAQMKLVLDKRETLAIAQSLGIPIPQAIEIDPGYALAPQIELLRLSERDFPLILKWAEPNRVVAAITKAGLELKKAEYVYSREGLLAALQPFAAIGEYPLVQRFAPGYGIGFFFLMKKGASLADFSHRRIREWPPEGGTSVVCESIEIDTHAEIRRKSLTLLQTIKWEGVAMVEYRYDPNTEAFTLMEINGRFWGSLPLASACGVHFAYEAYRAFALNSDLIRAPGYLRLRARYIIPETKRLIRIWFAPHLIENKNLRFRPINELFGYVTDFIRPSTRYFVFRWRDPRPLIADIKSVFKIASQVLLRK
jgi:predicted ATP-grasp superfamily ATP-dependent carboligase